MDNQKAIDALNTLVVINNDRMEGYATAIEDTEQADLKTLFAHFQKTSQQCHTELAAEVTRLGGTPDEGTRLTGKMYRMWMDVKSTLTNNDRKSVIDWCKYGEDVASESYQETLRKNIEYLSIPQQTMLKKQHSMLQADHNKVRDMRDELVGV